VALGVGAALAGVGYLGTEQLQGKAPLWTFGTGYPIGGRGLMCGVEVEMRVLAAFGKHVHSGWVLKT
jgi:hypothetical protein